MRILVADCRDSFVHTIVDYLRVLGAEVDIRRVDDFTAAEIPLDGVDGVLLSPGPGRPEAAGVCHDLLDRFAGLRPVLGVCLGHQVIAQHYGGRVVTAAEPRHGETSRLDHDGTGLFAGLPPRVTVTRYHSLVVTEPLPPRLLVTARAETGEVMALRHTDLDVAGVQFHPEAVLTRAGHRLLDNWLAGVRG